jgi:MFS family permease
MPGPTSTGAVPETGLTLRQYYLMVGLGAFVTTIAQPGVIGRLPLRILLKDDLHLGAQALATFMFVSTFAWNVKPVAGLLSDAFPLFGTRRRHYMIAGAGLAALSWLALGVAPHQYGWFLGAAIAANAFMVMASTVMGGLMVEAGQQYGVSGRITSTRQAVQSAVSLGNGILGGYLATVAFGWTAGIAAGLLLTLAVATVFALREPPHAAWRREVLGHAVAQLRTLAQSWTLWAAGIFLALVYITPGFATPLLYRQTNTLGFGTPYIGLMETIEGATGLAGAALYALVCRRLTLRRLLYVAIAVNALGTLLFLAYGYRTAPFIHGVSGLVGIWSELALMDLAVRATPPGCESLGFSLMMSARNFAAGGSDVIGAWLLDSRGWTFPELVWLNAATTGLVLLFVPLLPRPIVDYQDRDISPPAAAPADGAHGVSAAVGGQPD